MKLTATREDFLAPLQSVIGVVERRQTMEEPPGQHAALSGERARTADVLAGVGRTIRSDHAYLSVPSDHNCADRDSAGQVLRGARTAGRYRSFLIL
jgi:hypothetical protein